MLSLETSRWADLEHAYGDAGDVPGLLQKVLAGEQAALDELFGSICHQGSTYSASFAAIPHLVEAAARITDPETRAQVLSLVGEIVSSSDYRGESVPEDIRGWYKAVCPRALELAVETLSQPLDSHTAVYLLKTAATLKGFTNEGDALSGFADEEFPATCPGCGKDLFVTVDEEGLCVAAEDPVSHPEARHTEVVPSTNPPDRCHWLIGVSAGPLFTRVRLLLPHLYGTATCPACDVQFSLVDHLG